MVAQRRHEFTQAGAAHEVEVAELKRDAKRKADQERRRRKPEIPVLPATLTAEDADFDPF